MPSIARFTAVVIRRHFRAPNRLGSTGFDSRGRTGEGRARLGLEWVGLPARDGGSWYGQPVKGLVELQRFQGDKLLRLERA